MYRQAETNHIVREQNSGTAAHFLKDAMVITSPQLPPHGKIGGFTIQDNRFDHKSDGPCRTEPQPERPQRPMCDQMDCTSIGTSRGGTRASSSSLVDIKSTLVIRERVVENLDSNAMRGSDVFSGATSGSRTTNRLPLPNSLLKVTSPPSRRASSRTIDSPSPVPSYSRFV